MENTIKLTGVNPDIIKLQLFPFSLRDVAASWFDSMSYGSVDNWEELVEAFMERFFPPALTSKRRRDIIAFKQGEENSLYNAWERYKKLLKRCLMHEIDQITQMDIFYHAMNYFSKGIMMQLVVEHSRERVLKRPSSLLNILPKATIELQLRLQGAVVD